MSGSVSSRKRDDLGATSAHPFGIPGLGRHVTRFRAGPGQTPGDKRDTLLVSLFGCERRQLQVGQGACGERDEGRLGVGGRGSAGRSRRRSWPRSGAASRVPVRQAGRQRTKGHGLPIEHGCSRDAIRHSAPRRLRLPLWKPRRQAAAGASGGTGRHGSTSPPGRPGSSSYSPGSARAGLAPGVRFRSGRARSTRAAGCSSCTAWGASRPGRWATGFPAQRLGLRGRLRIRRAPRLTSSRTPRWPPW